MNGRLWLRPPRRVLTSFLLVVVACVAALAWLGYRLLEQDRALESQRVQDRLETAADLTAAALDRRLAELERALTAGPDRPRLPDGTVLVVVRGTVLEWHGTEALLYLPELDAPQVVSTDALRRAERVEFQANRPLAAAALFRDAANSASETVRAAALVGLGRSLRKAGRIDEALAAYADLASLGSTPVAGLPAELVAREASCSALEAAGRQDDLRREAEALARDLNGGRWRLTRSAYEFRVDEAHRWMGGAMPPKRPSEALALSAAVETLVDAWRASPHDSTGRRVEVAEGQAVLLAWRATPTSLTAIGAGPQYLPSVLHRDVVPDGRIRLALTSVDGRPIAGRLPDPTERAAVRTAAVTRQPWTIHVSGADPAALTEAIAGRQRLLLAGLSVLVLLLVVSSCFIARAMTRELAVARLQSEFVSSVSHEFRSPLTSIRQLSSMLVQGRLPSDDERQRSYEFLASETGRLERLIEGLLDFGLMEAGEARYRLERVDARDVVRDTVVAFRVSGAANGYQVDLSLPASACNVRADRDALGRAVWNLLDNAVKYSPENRTVCVEVAPRGAWLAIVVADQGMGIPESEHRTVFRKFVRGANSRQAGIKGTGIGLAMVTHIVAAHGGDIDLESAPGEGSRFTIHLPMEAEA